MTEDISACCEKLREAFNLIENNNLALAMAAIRNMILFLEGLDSVMWVEPEPDDSELGYDPDTLPQPGEEVLVTAESGSGKYRYIKMARYSPSRGWYGNFGNTARIIAWAYVEPYKGDAE